MKRAENLKKLSAIARTYGTFSLKEIDSLIGTFGKVISFTRIGDSVSIKACIEDEIFTVSVIEPFVRCKGAFVIAGRAVGCPYNHLAEKGGICGNCFDDFRDYQSEIECEAA